MSIEQHPSFPTLREQRDMLLACAERCDRYWAEPDVALAIAAAVVNELWPDDQTRRSLAFGPFVQAHKANSEPLSASHLFTLAAFEIHTQLKHTKDPR